MDLPTAELRKLMPMVTQRIARDAAKCRELLAGFSTQMLRMPVCYLKIPRLGSLKLKTEISKKGIEVETLLGWPDVYFSGCYGSEVGVFFEAQRKHSSGKMIMKACEVFATKGYPFSISIICC